MTAARMNLALASALIAAAAGCALAGGARTSKTPAVKSPSTPGLKTPTMTTETRADRPDIQLTSGQVPAAQSPVHSHHAQGAGHEFQRLPTIPAAPEALASNLSNEPDGEPLTLSSLEAWACQNNPTLLQARQQIEGELGKAIQAGLWPNPTLSYIQEQIGVIGTPGEFVGGTVRQRIVTGQKLDLSRAKYMARVDVAEWLALEQQYRVLNDVRINYFRARGNYDLMQIQRELLKSAEDNVLTAREQFNVGQATRAQVHLANVRLQRTRLDVLKSENDYRQSFETLTALIGVELPPTPLATPLEGNMTPIAFDDALQRLVDQAPQLRAAQSKLRSDQITIHREMAQPVPDIVVEGGAGRNFEAGGTVATARIGIEVPIFDWNQGTIRQAEADYSRQQGEVRRLELVLKQDLAHVYRDYLTALQHTQNYAEVILPEARSAYELQLRSYKENRISWPEVLRTQEEYFMLRAEYVRNLTVWRESEVLIDGFLLHGGLQAAPAPPPPGHIDSVPKPR